MGKFPWDIHPADVKAYIARRRRAWPGFGSWLEPFYLPARRVVTSKMTAAASTVALTMYW